MPGHRVQGFGFRVERAGFGVQGSGCRVRGSRVEGLRDRVVNLAPARLKIVCNHHRTEDATGTPCKPVPQGPHPDEYL